MLAACWPLGLYADVTAKTVMICPWALNMSGIDPMQKWLPQVILLFIIKSASLALFRIANSLEL